jgi:hypothetical protein
MKSGSTVDPTGFSLWTLMFFCFRMLQKFWLPRPCCVVDFGTAQPARQHRRCQVRQDIPAIPARPRFPCVWRAGRQRVSSLNAPGKQEKPGSSSVLKGLGDPATAAVSATRCCPSIAANEENVHPKPLQLFAGSFGFRGMEGSHRAPLPVGVMMASLGSRTFTSGISFALRQEARRRSCPSREAC